MLVLEENTTDLLFKGWIEHTELFPELQEEMNRRNIAVSHLNTNNLNNRQNNTYQKYVGYYDNIWDFFKLIGEMGSMIILLEQCPEFPPPMDAIAIKKYLMYKRGKEGVPLTINDEEVLTTSGELVKCTEEWVSPINEVNFKSAISTLHEMRNCGGAYITHCRRCEEIKLNDNHNFNGCPQHHGNTSMAEPRGNPTKSVIIRDHMKEIRLITSGYIANSKDSLDPFEMHRVYQSLTAQNSLEAFELYALISLGKSTGARNDEYIRFHVRNIHLAGSIIRSDYTVDALCFMLEGKKDEGPTYLRVYRNPLNQLHCALNATLWWLCLTGITDGYLYPPAANVRKMIGNPATSRSYNIHIGYESTLKSIKRIFGGVPKSESNMNRDEDDYGTHSIHHSELVEKYFRGADDSACKPDMRMKSADTLFTYKTDALARMEQEKLKGNNVSHFLPPYQGQYTSSRRIPIEFSQDERMRVLEKIKNKWLEDNPFGGDIRKISTVALSYQKVDQYQDSLVEKVSILRNLLASQTTMDVALDTNGFFSLLSKVFDLRMLIQAHGTAVHITINTSQRIDEAGGIAAVFSNQVEQQIGTPTYLDVPGRVELPEQLLNANDAREQMELIVEFLKKPESSNLSKCLDGKISASKFEPTVRSAFICQKIKTMMHCYTNHCKCSLDIFASFHKKKKSSREMKKVCSSNTCNQ